MDLNYNNIGGEAKEDRISQLPDFLFHHILSFLDIKCVARTSILSQRCHRVWTSFPILDFSNSSLRSTEVNTFMDFVNSTLLLHDGPSIHKFSLCTNRDMKANRVHSWIENITRRDVEQVSLFLDLDKPFFVPMSLCTCESLVALELGASQKSTIHLPKGSLSLPKLQSLTLRGIQFTDDSSWNEQHFSNCPILEELNLEGCTWFGVRSFCISTPALKHLSISNDIIMEESLLDCALKIHAPNLVSLAYRGSVAKDYVLSSFQTLESARVLLYGYDEPTTEQKKGYYGASVSKFFLALSHVQSLTIESLEVLSVVQDFPNILPTFHNLDKLFLELEETTDKSVFLLLKAAPNLTSLVFEVRTHIHHKEEEEDDSWAGHILKAGCLFEHLQSVCFVCFSGIAWEMRWLKLILKNSKALQKVTIRSDYSSANAKGKELLMSEFPSLPKASDGCVLEFH